MPTTKSTKGFLLDGGYPRDNRIVARLIFELPGVAIRLLMDLNVAKQNDGINRFALQIPSCSSCPSC